MAKLTYKQERYEEDRLNLIHKIVFKSELEKWDEVEKYKALYKEIYGDIAQYTQLQMITPTRLPEDTGWTRIAKATRNLITNKERNILRRTK